MNMYDLCCSSKSLRRLGTVQLHMAFMRMMSRQFTLQLVHTVSHLRELTTFVQSIDKS